MKSLSFTTLTYPNSRHSLSWTIEFESVLQGQGFKLERKDETDFRVALTWRPKTFELVMQEYYEYLLTTRYLRTPPRSGLRAKLHLRMIFHHLAEVAGILLVPRFRDMKKLHGRRNLDISKAYVAQLAFLESCSSAWLLHLEDDAKLRVTEAQAATIISTMSAEDPDQTWMVDLSKSFTLGELGIDLDHSSELKVEGVRFTLVNGRASNTFCSILVPRKLWLEFLTHLESSIEKPGLRLIPCDWLFNDFAHKKDRSLSAGNLRTFLSEDGVFVQTSLHHSPQPQD